jgi:beta-mannosidase
MNSADNQRKPIMIISILNGSWKLDVPERSKPIPAIVPGWTQSDLERAGIIESPFWRDNAKSQRWISNSNWRYHRTFKVSPEFIKHDAVLLRCHGLDTFAKITINGKTVGKTDNMYRLWEFDVKKSVKPGENRIEISFDSVVPYIDKKYKERPLLQWGDKDPLRIPHYQYIRKAPYQFGWDWAPAIMGYGIWKDIELVAYNTARIAEVSIEQVHAEKNVSIIASGKIERVQPGRLSAHVSIRYKGSLIAGQIVAVTNNSFKARMGIVSPRLWWPNGLGKQPLYDLSVTLLDNKGIVID